LIEQIIASHPLVYGAGESQILTNVIRSVEVGSALLYPDLVCTMDATAISDIGARYVARVRELAPKCERVTDKTTSNYLFVGLIHLVLPNAKIIHTVRDPIDTCVSCFSILFNDGQDYAYDLGELGRYYRHYERLMTHWRDVLPPGRILDVRYEDVVTDLDGQARRIIKYCKLPWDDRCLSFHRTNRPVATASAVQVRQPIHTSGVGRWRVYKRHLGPLLRALNIVPATSG